MIVQVRRRWGVGMGVEDRKSRQNSAKMGSEKGATGTAR